MNSETLQTESNLLIIAEIANTHNGDFNRACKLVTATKESGANAIKFQIFKVEHLVRPDHPEYEIFRKLQFNDKEWETLINISKK